MEDTVDVSQAQWAPSVSAPCRLRGRDSGYGWVVQVEGFAWIFEGFFREPVLHPWKVNDGPGADLSSASSEKTAWQTSTQMRSNMFLTGKIIPRLWDWQQVAGWEAWKFFWGWPTVGWGWGGGCLGWGPSHPVYPVGGWVEIHGRRCVHSFFGFFGA